MHRLFDLGEFDYSQRKLIDKINIYQTLMQRSTISTRGCCHGLAVFWISKMAEQKGQSFYDTVKYIINTPPQEYDNALFEKFLARVEFGQNPVTSGLMITHRHLRVILEMDNIEFWNFKGTYPNLYNRIRPKKHPAAYLVAHKDHAIALFQCGDQYHVYDSNYITGEAKIFRSKKCAAEEIMARLLPGDQRAKDKTFELELSFIPLNSLSHPTTEVIIDMPDESDDSSMDEGTLGYMSSPTCSIL